MTDRSISMDFRVFNRIVGGWGEKLFDFGGND